MILSIKSISDIKLLQSITNAKINQKAYQHFDKFQSIIPDEYEFFDASEGKVYKKQWMHTLSYVRGEFELRPMRFGLNDKNQSNTAPQVFEINNKAASLNNKAVIPHSFIYKMIQSNGHMGLNQQNESENTTLYQPAIYDTLRTNDEIIQAFAIIDMPSFELDDAYKWLKEDL